MPLLKPSSSSGWKRPPLTSPSLRETFPVPVTWQQGGRMCPVPHHRAAGTGRGGGCRAANRRMLWSRDSSRHLGPGGQGVQGGAGPSGSWCGGSRLPTPSPGVLMPHGTSCAIEQGVFAGTQPARRRRTQCTPCPGHEQLHPIPSGLIAPQAHGTLCRCWYRWPPAAAWVRQGKGRGCRASDVPTASIFSPSLCQI